MKRGNKSCENRLWEKEYKKRLMKVRTEGEMEKRREGREDKEGKQNKPTK